MWVCACVMSCITPDVTGCSGSVRAFPAYVGGPVEDRCLHMAVLLACICGGSCEDGRPHMTEVLGPNARDIYDTTPQPWCQGLQVVFCLVRTQTLHTYEERY